MADKKSTSKSTKKESTEETSARGVEGEMPKTGYEGGVVEEGTGDFAPGTDADEGPAKDEKGIDGKNPVSPQNPPTKAVLGGGDESTSEGNEFAEPVNES